ncbi:hypothetical protein L249_5643 [Ophiocordyceps polyrhachis-furcata BCC 54312]|uniref:Uncharacterized protein n=1 Tax=Ophiocordyceps polyrhachis-furcata BCC 54312 TaxID=1330021 RepID=A0A367LH68_9HYPO|nr:hypothetical protein L249_5643 [Ophiocordyceps polyrhachis-furcata BCC 54312]
MHPIRTHAFNSLARVVLQENFRAVWAIMDTTDETSLPATITRAIQKSVESAVQKVLQPYATRSKPSWAAVLAAPATAPPSGPPLVRLVPAR